MKFCQWQWACGWVLSYASPTGASVVGGAENASNFSVMQQNGRSRASKAKLSKGKRQHSKAK
jgi:hypothetical protein